MILCPWNNHAFLSSSFEQDLQNIEFNLSEALSKLLNKYLTAWAVCI